MIVLNERQRLIRYFRHLPKRVRRMNDQAVLYSAALWLSLGLIFIKMLALYGDSAVFDELADVLFGMVMVLVVWAFLYDAHGWLDPLNLFFETTWVGKAVFAGCVLVSSAVSYIYTLNIINEFTRVADNPLPYSAILLSVAAFPVMIVLGLLCVWAVLIAALFFKGLLSIVYQWRDIVPSMSAGQKRQARRFTLSLLRALGCYVLIAVALELAPSYHHLMTRLGRHIAYLEALPHDPCARQGERVCRLNDALVLVAKSPDDFSLRRCASSITLSNSMPSGQDR